MTVKYHLTGAIAAGITLFLWGAIANMAIPWPGPPILEFKDSAEVARTVRAHAPQNGVYLAGEGIFAAVSMTPDMTDQTDAIGDNLAVEFAADLIVGFLLSVSLLYVSPAHRVGAAGMMALAAGVATHLSDWNWFGFSTPFATAALAELVIGWILAGAVLQAIGNRMLPPTLTARAAV